MAYKNHDQIIQHTTIKTQNFATFCGVYGQIEPISKTNLSAKQRQLAREIKRARHLALMPFAISA